MRTMEERAIDVEAMKASWLEAVAAGEAENFARHFVPDILTALTAAQREAAYARERQLYAEQESARDKKEGEGWYSQAQQLRAELESTRKELADLKADHSVGKCIYERRALAAEKARDDYHKKAIQYAEQRDIAKKFLRQTLEREEKALDERDALRQAVEQKDAQVAQCWAAMRMAQGMVKAQVWYQEAVACIKAALGGKP